MAKNYPRSQTFFIFIICAIAVGSLLIYTHANSLASNPEVSGKVIYATANSTDKNNQASVNSVITGPSATDWQKQFLLDKKSNIKLSAEPIQANKKTDPLTLTDEMGRNLFTHYMELKQGNLTDNDQFVQNAVNQTIDEAVNAAKQAKVYSSADILINPNSDTNAVRDYANSVAKIVVIDGPKVNAVQIAADAMEKGDLKSLSNIDPVVISYKNMVSRLKSLRVPSALSQSHLDLLNGFSMIEHMTESLRNVSKDPMQAIVALDAHAKSEQLAVSALQGIQSYIKSHGLTFANNEAGSFFVTASLVLE
jgi:hypothetical protein